jgi:hypothetical protein
MIKLFRTYIQENNEIWNDDLKSQIYTIAERMVELEDKFIDLSFATGAIEGLTAEEVKEYIYTESIGALEDTLRVSESAIAAARDPDISISSANPNQ